MAAPARQPSPASDPSEAFRAYIAQQGLRGTRQRLAVYGPDLEDLIGAGCHSFAADAGAEAPPSVEVIDRRQNYKACARSWKRRPDVGSNPAYTDLSARDAAAAKKLG